MSWLCSVRLSAFGLALGLLATPIRGADEEVASDLPVDESLYQALEWRNIGPFRGGRATTVAGVRQRPLTFYMGATGGGVWKTTDAGTSWENVSDGFFHTGSVGAIEVAPSDPNVVYVGMGERCVRGVATSHGDGVYRSTDGGKSWEHIGLAKTRHISAVRVHPQDPDIVYVAAQGDPYQPTEHRGIYRSSNGGRTWQQVLAGDPKAGASDLSMDPTNPRVLYAAFWEHQRLPWKIISGGPNSGIFKSTDGGDSWKKLDKGLPDLMGKVAVAVSPADPERVWALVEADGGGLYRSDDAGESWDLVNEDRVLRARAWYYIHVFADPLDAETVYVLNAPFLKSTDGGKTFSRIAVPHGDNHGLWIHPEDNQRMINANDGGANVSFNGGRSWSTQDNQPTAQFYRVIADAQFPYRVYGGQQDNTSVAIASRSFDGAIGREDWHAIGGCESAWVALDPDDPALTYATCIVGGIDEHDRRTDLLRPVMAYDFMGLGMHAEEMPFRFNWNAPVVASPHDPRTIYHAGNKVLRTTDRGVTWDEISPDLTRDEVDKQGAGGGPITNEGAGGEVYNTILYLAESPHESGVIWVGTDDGLVQLTRDGGTSWNDVTPPGLPESMINSIEISPHDPAKVYLAVTRYKFGDFSPMIFATEDYGAGWRAIAGGLAQDSFVRVVREDPVRPGLLYAGTETGLRVSFDNGKHWQSLQLNLPVVPITDLTIRNNDLIAATQGRAFWILDDLTPLQQLDPEVAAAGFHLFEPRTAHRISAPGFRMQRRNVGRNPVDGVVFHYLLEEALDEQSEDELVLEILDPDGVVLRRMSSRLGETEAAPSPFFATRAKRLPTEKGMNRFAWDLRRDDLVRVKGLVNLAPMGGPMVPPGTYSARLTLGELEAVQPVVVAADPRKATTPLAYAEQQKLILAIADRVDEIHQTVLDLRDVKGQIEGWLERASGHAAFEAIQTAGEAVIEAIDGLEAKLVQPESKTFQDIINFPNQLNMDYLDLMSKVDGSAPPVNQGSRRRFEDLEAVWTERVAERDAILTELLPTFNELFVVHKIPAVVVPAAEPEVEEATEPAVESRQL